MALCGYTGALAPTFTAAADGRLCIESEAAQLDHEADWQEIARKAQALTHSNKTIRLEPWQPTRSDTASSGASPSARGGGGKGGLGKRPLRAPGGRGAQSSSSSDGDNSSSSSSDSDDEEEEEEGGSRTDAVKREIARWEAADVYLCVTRSVYRCAVYLPWLVCCPPRMHSRLVGLRHRHSASRDSLAVGTIELGGAETSDLSLAPLPLSTAYA